VAALARSRRIVASLSSPRVLVGAAAFVTVAIRIVDIAGPSFTGDEAANLALSQGGVWNHLEALHAVPYPPLWYGLLGMWTLAFGGNDLAARLFSVVAAVLFIPVIAEVTRRMFGGREAVVAAFLGALWPLLVQEQREIRAYTWLALATALALLGLLHAAERRRPRDWALAGLGLAALASIHHFGFLAAVALGVGALAIWPGTGPLIAASVTVVAYLPTAYFDSNMDRSIIPFGASELSLGEYIVVLSQVIVGRLHLDRALVVMGAFAFVPALAVGVWRAGRWRWLYASIVVTNVLVPIALTRTVINWLLGPDHFAPLVPFAILAVARFATAPWPVLVRPYTAFLAAILVAAIPQVVLVEPYRGTDWRAVVATIEARTTNELAVYVAPYFHEAPLAHYYRGALPIAAIPGDDPRAAPETPPPTLATLVAAGSPSWLVLDEPEVERLPASGWREIARFPELRLFRIGP
jgi:4-amino-4-deoxy-L-arabinose transferase-like glycosyltransferase